MRKTNCKNCGNEVETELPETMLGIPVVVMACYNCYPEGVEFNDRNQLVDKRDSCFPFSRN